MSDKDSFTHGHKTTTANKNVDEIFKQTIESLDNILITDKKCEICSGALLWIGVQTLHVKKYQCTKCYKIFSIIDKQ